MPQSRLLSPGNTAGSSILSPESLELTRDANAAAAAATASGQASPRIRVRQDLMQHLGLVARSSANIVQTDRSGGSGQRLLTVQQPQQLLQLPISAAAAVPTLQLTVAKPQPLPPTQQQTSATPNLAKLLSESSSGMSNSSSSGDMTGNAAAAAALTNVSSRSSNSQLFKSSESSSGAIPLTFNNSIAEVLAAAASKTKLNVSREPSPKPEITITAKSSSAAGAANRQQYLPGGTTATATPKFSVLKQQQASKASGVTGGLPGHTSGGSLITVSTAAAGTTTTNYGNSSLSILKRPMAGSSGDSSSAAGGGVNPISNMTKLLQAQAPGLPPHIIAQQALPSRSSPKV